MATVTDWLTKVTSYAYDGAGRLSTTTYPNGVVATNGYNDADRLTSVTNAKGSTFSSFTYTLDGVGNRTQVVANNGTTTFAYDNLYRLTSVTYPGPTTDTYTYDALGNRLTKNATSYTYDNADEMTAAGGVSYGYDGSGNQTSRGSDTYAFDHDHRMTQAVSSGVTSSSVYYGDGVRKSHTVNGTTTSYKYDVLASLPVVIQDGTYSYVYGLDLISMTDGSGNQKYLSYDGLGSVTDITDGSGTVTDTFVYDVFGAVKTRTGTSATAWKFTGEQADDGSGDSGYYFLRARYYDTATGRFVGRDRLEFSQRYAYVGNNPALLLDPSGNWPGEGLLKSVCGELCGFCVNGAAGLGAGGVASGCLVWTADSIGIVRSWGGGADTGEVALTVGFMRADGARTISDLSGPFTYLGIGGGEGFVGGWEGAAGRTSDGRLVVTNQVAGGLGFKNPLLASFNAYGGVSTTSVKKEWSWRD